MQLRLSERSGRGVPKIVGAYGRESIRIEKNFIVVTIPFNRINVTPFELNGGGVSEVKVHDLVNDLVNDPVNDPVNDILEILRSHSDYSYKQIAETIGKSEATVKRGIAKLKSLNKIRRIGSDKSGHWEIVN